MDLDLMKLTKYNSNSNINSHEGTIEKDQSQIKTDFQEYLPPS